MGFEENEYEIAEQRMYRSFFDYETNYTNDEHIIQSTEIAYRNFV